MFGLPEWAGRLILAGLLMNFLVIGINSGMPVPAYALEASDQSGEIGYLIEHRDGFRTTMVLADIRDFNYAGNFVGTFFARPKMEFGDEHMKDMFDAFAKADAVVGDVRFFVNTDLQANRHVPSGFGVVIWRWWRFRRRTT